MAKLFESDDYIISAVFVLFLVINFNQQIGIIYSVMVVIDWIMYNLAIDRNAFKPVPIEKDKSARWVNLVWGMGAYVVFIFVSQFLISRLFSSAASTGGAIDNISQLISSSFSATPVLYSNKYIRLGVWGITIAFQETRFFFRTLLGWVVKSSGYVMPTNILSVPAVILAGFIAGIFAIFHIVAKGITNNASLFVTFIFGFVSVMLVIYFREYIQAAFLHLITNTIATMSQLQIGFFVNGGFEFNSAGVTVLAGVLLVSWVLLFQELPLVNML